MILRRGWIFYLAGLLLAIVAGVLAVLALQQAVPAPEPVRPPTRPVIVAKQAIAARQVVLIESLEVRDFLLDEIPSGAIFRMEDAVGKFSFQNVEAGQPLLAQNLASLSAGGASGITTTARLAALLPADKLGVALPATDLLSKSGDVDTGDRIDIMASLIVVGGEEGQGGQVTLLTLQDVPVVKTLEEAVQQPANSNQPPPRGKITGLIVAVDPQDAVTLKYFVDSGANVSIAVRPPKLTSIFQVIPVTLNYLADKFGIKVPEPLP
ncbi:MAG: Flp pilus assembly protein CpaB [Chloroflexi bacterium]|nr:Flp pilus assembly protein CpaB [Chloroflexota bacterium]